MARVFTITEGLENMGALKTGGQGSVYKAKRYGEIISAVKLLPTPVNSDNPNDKSYRDFLNEVEKLKKVNEEPDPNVVKILGSGITDTGGFPFIEMEYIEGPDLEELLKPPREPIFTIKEAIKVADHLSHALAHCHKVDVKHGDIKSNNVKYNVHTGNYVLLDFGLALMSDEQRRTSLRQAGAAEFMAPEQNEELMLFQTDVYSFGVVLYELLAGQVPFPLKDKGETARNMIKLAHMETPPPDLLQLRRQNLPQHWPEDKKTREMQLPYWLTSMVYKCLEKKPENRFANGMQLHEYFVMNATLASGKSEMNNEWLNNLQKENEKLQREKAQLQNLVLQYQQTPVSNNNDVAALRATISDKDREILALKEKETYRLYQTPAPRKGISPALFIILVFITIALAVYAGYAFLVKDTSNPNEKEPEPVANTIKGPSTDNVIGQFKVLAARAYFHNEPDEASRRSAYMVPSTDVINGYEERNGFLYTEFTNSRGQTSKGWLKRSDLMTLAEWEEEQKKIIDTTPVPLTRIEINDLLQQAKALMDSRNTYDALTIYKRLLPQEVPEAMYHYGHLALQGRNDDIECEEAKSLIKKASNEGYTEAKRTLGFLYLFANNRQAIELANYDRCNYERNIVKGTQLLMEAALAGDTQANDILEDYKSKNDDQQQ
jgi:serine/threonine-protein kinase